MPKPSLIEISSAIRLTVAIVALTCLTAQTAVFAADKPVIAVIVANDHPIKSLSLAELKLIYWRKKTYWANGQRMHPVNLPTDNPLRLQFSSSILGSLPSAQNDYWNGLYFHGTSPPHVVYSDEAVIRYVQETTGSIGYVDACKLEARAKPVFWIMSNGDTSTDLPNFSCD
jgi:ABC-type phosphate transport system substrate-binding protein